MKKTIVDKFVVVVVFVVVGLILYFTFFTNHEEVKQVKSPAEMFDSQVKVYETARLDLTTDVYKKDSITREALKNQLVSQRNLKVNENIITNMREAFRQTNQPLADTQIKNIVSSAEKLTVEEYAKTYKDELINKLNFVASENTNVNAIPLAQPQ